MLITRRLYLALIAVVAVTANLRAADSTPVDVTALKAPIKLACIGDSITQGVGAAGGKSWPDQLQTMLGDRWQVRNFGVSGSTLMNSGDKPYQKEGAFKNALEFTPDVVVILLGTNDTKPQNWKHKDQFTTDYHDLIGKFTALPSKPRIFISYAPYIVGQGNFGISEENTVAEFPLINAIAKATKASIIDVHASLAGKDALIPDRMHPNTEGATEIATAVHHALTSKAP
ncbi:MAG TPA: GDSL-type esterase/lipase family protein [Planctomycetota bacterium]|nr:GDSL-type esterase/lipase family protein [Planctomycetota bacterium]